MIDEPLSRLHEQIRHCRSCRLHETRTHAMPGWSGADARAMILGEAPGEKEDLSGLPFQGMSGRMLDELLASAGLNRGMFFITGAVKCRPPNNRNPKPDELATCRGLWLLKQIGYLNPPLIVCVGAVAVRQLLGIGGKVRELREREWEWEGRKVVVTYHPAGVLRSRIRLGDPAREDWKKVRVFLEGCE